MLLSNWDEPEPVESRRLYMGDDEPEPSQSRRLDNSDMAPYAGCGEKHLITGEPKLHDVTSGFCLNLHAPKASTIKQCLTQTLI